MTKRKWLALAAATATLAGLTGAAAVTSAHAAVVVPAGPAEQTSCPDPGVLAGSHPTQVGLFQKAIADALPCAFASTAWEPAGSRHLVVYLAPLNAHTRSVAQGIIDKTKLDGVLDVTLKGAVQSYARAKAQGEAIAKRFGTKVIADLSADGRVTVHSNGVGDADVVAASHIQGYQADPSIDHQADTTVRKVNGGKQVDWSSIDSAYTTPGSLVGAYDVGSCDKWYSSGNFGVPSGTLRGCGGAYSSDYLPPLSGSGPNMYAYADYGAGASLFSSASGSTTWLGNQNLGVYGDTNSMEGVGTIAGSYVSDAVDMSSAWTVSGWFEFPHISAADTSTTNTVSSSDHTITNCGTGGLICPLWGSEKDDGNYAVLGLWKWGSTDYGLQMFVEEPKAGCGSSGYFISYTTAWCGMGAPAHPIDLAQDSYHNIRGYFITTSYDGGQNIDIYVNGVWQNPLGTSGCTGPGTGCHSEVLPSGITLPAQGGPGDSYTDISFGTALVNADPFVDADLWMSHLSIFSADLTPSEVQDIYAAEAKGTSACTTTNFSDQWWLLGGSPGIVSGAYAPLCESHDVAGTGLSTWTSGGSLIDNCTEGWALADGTTGAIYRETAGHCVTDNTSKNAPWKASSGATTVSCYWCPGYQQPAPSGYSSGDYPADLVLTDNHTWDSTSNAYAGYLYNGSSIVGVAHDEPSPLTLGTSIYKFGVNSGYSAGTISSLAAWWTDPGTGNRILTTASTDLNPGLIGGDSGGPVWTYDAGDGKVSAVGTNEGLEQSGSTQTNYFNDEAQMEQWTGLSLVTCGC